MEEQRTTDLCRSKQIALALALFLVCTGTGRADEKDVTGFIVANTAVPATVNREWKKNCPDWFCGSEQQKSANVNTVRMNKVSDDKILVQGTVIANASFGPLSLLDDKQVVKVSGAANPIVCTFKLEKLTFADGVAQFLVDLFGNLKGKVYPFKDKRGKCDQYFPEDL